MNEYKIRVERVGDKFADAKIKVGSNRYIFDYESKTRSGGSPKLSQEGLIKVVKTIIKEAGRQTKLIDISIKFEE